LILIDDKESTGHKQRQPPPQPHSTAQGDATRREREHSCLSNAIAQSLIGATDTDAPLGSGRKRLKMTVKDDQGRFSSESDSSSTPPLTSTWAFYSNEHPCADFIQFLVHGGFSDEEDQAVSEAESLSRHHPYVRLVLAAHDLPLFNVQTSKLASPYASQILCRRRGTRGGLLLRQRGQTMAKTPHRIGPRGQLMSQTKPKRSVILHFQRLSCE